MTIDLVPTIRQIPIASLRLDGGTQIRQERSEETIADYAEKMRAGEVFPPVVAYYDGEEYWLADGFQRVMARGLAGASTIDVDVRPGTQRDAILFACGANAEHGAQRTNEDKRSAVETAVRLYAREDIRKSDADVANICRVSNSFVHAQRQLLVKGGLDLPTKVLGKDGRTRETASVGENMKKSKATKQVDTLAQSSDSVRKSPIEGLLSTIVAVHVGWEGYAERFAELWPKATDEDRAELITRLSECRRQASKFIHALEKM